MGSKLTQQIVRELLEYNPRTGKLTWKKRSRKWFRSTSWRDGSHFQSSELRCAQWNKRWAGKRALDAPLPINKTGVNGVYLASDGLYHAQIEISARGKRRSIGLGNLRALPTHPRPERKRTNDIGSAKTMGGCHRIFPRR